jgi:acetyltransferase
MTGASLDPILAPQRVAVVGASDTPGSVGQAVFANMLAAGFHGEVHPINFKRDTIQGQPAFRTLSDLPERPDLVVICTPSQTVPPIIEQAGELGVRGVVVISAGFREAGEDGKALEQQVLDIARRFPGMRIIGPNCLGVITPGLGLNASFAATTPHSGRVAFISQSGALGTSVLDWAARKDIGLSHFVSVGNMIDVGFGDLIDYFGADDSVSAVLLYIESLTDARRFMSAARAFTRTKPIIAYKAGRFARSAAAAMSHTGALMGADDVHDAAFRRCGIERVYSIDDLFDCAELLARQRAPKRGRLGIVTNAGGPGVMASDALLAEDGELADLSPATVEKLNDVLPPFWSHGNPVDVLGDAPPKRYADALAPVLADDGVDAVLVILTPQAMTDPTETAKQVAAAVKDAKKPVLTAWLGGVSVAEGRQVLSDAGLPTYPSPERAIRGLMHLVDHAKNIETLYETPLPSPPDVVFNRDRGGRFAQSILSKPDHTLSEIEAKQLLDAYGIPTTRAVRAPTAEEAARQAGQIGYPVVLKLLSPDITHKTDVGGVKLNLKDESAVKTAFEQIQQSARAAHPTATIEGVSVQPMANIKGTVELILGMNRDPIFGNVVLLGAGGVTAEIMKDKVLGLPPLTEALVRNMLARLRTFPLLTGYRGRPAVDLDKLVETIIRFSFLVADAPNLKEFDINPLLIGPEGALALDARGLTGTDAARPDARYSHLAIRPYPAELQDRVTLADGTAVELRPIKPSDESAWRAMLARSSEATIRARFFTAISDFSHDVAARYVFTDYDRELAIAAFVGGQMHGVCRQISDPAGDSAEIALFIEDAWQGRRLGSALLDYGIMVARERGTKSLVAETLPDNTRMIQAFKEHGFATQIDRDEGIVHATRTLA